MEILSTNSVKPEQVSLILGFFDGIHQGHRKVILSAVEQAKLNRQKSVLVTLKNSPAEYFKKDYKYIFPREHSYKLIENLGVDYIEEQDFSKVADISAGNYLNYLLSTYEPYSIHTGFNYTYGKDKLGTAESLKSFEKNGGYKYFCIPPVTDGDKTVSSSFIKELLSLGKIKKAKEMLCSSFILKSVVKKGMQLGRKLGFPTANMYYPQNITKIPYGVYKANIFNKPAVLNWGLKPTIGGKEELLELHIPNFSGDLYEKELEFEIIEKIRDEVKFSSLEELKAQIIKDTQECLKS